MQGVHFVKHLCENIQHRHRWGEGSQAQQKYNGPMGGVDLVVLLVFIMCVLIRRLMYFCLIPMFLWSACNSCVVVCTFHVLVVQVCVKLRVCHRGHWWRVAPNTRDALVFEPWMYKSLFFVCRIYKWNILQGTTFFIFMIFGFDYQRM